MEALDQRRTADWIPSQAHDALQMGLRELGYVEGKNLKIEYRFGGDELQTLGKLAAELVALGPDATPPIIATKRATSPAAREISPCRAAAFATILENRCLNQGVSVLDGE